MEDTAATDKANTQKYSTAAFATGAYPREYAAHKKSDE